MKKRIAFVLVLVLAFCMILSSCDATSQQQMSSRFAVSAKVIVNNLKADYAFRVVSKNPLAQAGVVTFAWYSHAVVGKNTQLHSEWDTEDVGFDRNLAIQNRTWLANKLGTDEEGLKENYGELWILRRYTDFSVAVTIADRTDGSRFINVIKMTEDEIKKVEIEYDASNMQRSYFSRIGNKFYIARMNKVVNLDDMTVSTETVQEYYPEWLTGVDDALSKARDYMGKNPALKDIYEKTSGGTTLLSAREIDDKLFYAASVNYASYSELYCLIFDAATGEALYAAVVTTPDVGDDPEQSRFVGSFVLAEPVLANGNGYYDIV